MNTNRFYSPSRESTRCERRGEHSQSFILRTNMTGSQHSHAVNLRRNRRVSAPLSPIFYLFLAPTGILYQKVRRLLTEDETTEGSHPPVVIKYRHPGPKHPACGIPASEWPTVLAAYGVSHETIRRLIRATPKVHLETGASVLASLKSHPAPRICEQLIVG